MKILINSVFVGDYAYNKNNLPHEMINFFKADNDNYYVYVTPSGNVKFNDIEVVLFVKKADNGLIEILAKAEIGKEDTKPTDDCKTEIKYGGTSITELFNNNVDFKDDKNPLVTFKAKSIEFPSKTVFLTNKEDEKETSRNVCYIGDKRIANSSMRLYVDNNEKLEGIVNDKRLWKTEAEKLDIKTIEDNKNFFKVTRQQDNEVMFSNMFFYLFTEYPDFLKDFSKNVLGIEEELTNPVVEREKERMDIRIIDDKYYIIIENKIKSHINGIGKKNERDNNSQLSNYYKKAEKKNDEDKKSRKIKCFLFKPNYNPINDDLLKKYSCGEKYEIINYEEIWKFFNKIKIDDIYFTDFIKAMEKHTQETDTEFRNELMLRLKERITTNNKNKKTT